jgi:uncharacterized protein YdiU (UPF0061 family)
MPAKLGLLRQLPGDGDLVKCLTAAMQASGSDFTDCIRELSRVPLPQAEAASEAATPGACRPRRPQLAGRQLKCVGLDVWRH